MNNSLLIAFAGRSGSGKDTAAFYISGLFSACNIKTLSFAEPIKRGLVELFGFPDMSFFEDRDKKESVHNRYSDKTPRQLMQWMGSDIFRNQVSSQHWIQLLERRVESMRMNKEADIVIVTDVRFPDEVECIKNLGGTVIYIDADKRLSPKQSSNHISETILNETKKKCNLNIENNDSLSAFFSTLDSIFSTITTHY